MGRQIIRQPDGRLAVFSSVVDAWVLFDAEPEEVVAEFVDDAAQEAERQVRRDLEQVEEHGPRAYGQFGLTFEQADERSREHGHCLADLQAGIGLADEVPPPSPGHH